MIELATFKCSLYSYDHSLISEYGNVTIIKNDVEQYWIRTDNNNDKRHIGWTWRISNETIFAYPPKMIYLSDTSSSSNKNDNTLEIEMEAELEIKGVNTNIQSHNMNHTSMFIVMRDEIDTKSILQLIYECNSISKLFFRLDILLRDSFFTSLYSELSTTVKQNYIGEYNNDITWIRKNENINEIYETFFDMILLLMGVRPLHDRYLHDENNDKDKVDKEKTNNNDENENNDSISSSNSGSSSSTTTTAKNKSKSAKLASFGFPYLSSILHSMVREIVDKTADANSHMNMIEMNVDKFLDLICSKDLLMHMKSIPREVQGQGKQGKLQSISDSLYLDSRDGIHNNGNSMYSSDPMSASDNTSSLSLEYAQLLSPSQCVYCQVHESESKNTLKLHPYVPHNFQGRPIYICVTCHSNWRAYRDAALEADALVYEGEVNEELCSVCSDSPSELVMCGNCPRSFCNGCIQEILTIAEQSVMNESEDWICMCCAPKKYSNRANTSSTISRSNNQLEYSNSTGSGTSSNDSKNKSNGKTENQKKRNKSLKRKDDSVTVTMKNRNDDCNHGSKPKTSTNNVSSSITTNGNSKDGDKNQSKKSYSSVANITSNMPALSSFNDAYYFEQYVSYLNKRGLSMMNMRELNKKKLKKQKQQQKSSKDKGKSKNKSDGNTAKEEVETDMMDPRETLGTEDFCYLCKDGGDLIECDHTTYSNAVISPSSSSSSSSQSKQIKIKAQRVTNSSHKIPIPCSCVKVYHQYCLSYLVPEDSEWNCPRHYCDACGSVNIFFMCKFCPISFCASCPKKFYDNYGLNRYISLDWSNYKSFYEELGYHDKDSSLNISLIVCENCINTMERCSSNSMQELFKVNSINHMNIKLLVGN